MLRASGLKETAKCVEVVYNKHLLPRCFGVFSSLRTQDIVEPPDSLEPSIPPYVERQNEPVEVKRARLLYQSRKRGMLENGLLLSTFAAKHLPSMNPDMLKDYDRLINLPSNDWDLYYWATGVKETPSEFDTEIMRMLKDHCKNEDRQSRIRQPDLH